MTSVSVALPHQSPPFIKSQIQRNSEMIDHFTCDTGFNGHLDDMTLAAIAGVHKRLITSPPVAVFLHQLGSDLNFGSTGIV
ncbi:hypothetical protein AAHA92_16010 [Salvia divinorum]|uniref:Uncharacterized protein n=1 Tax=Salvia divinorum TaxID=28513 RepID=A0ABD1GU55_SALDI